MCSPFYLNHHNFIQIRAYFWKRYVRGLQLAPIAQLQVHPVSVVHATDLIVAEHFRQSFDPGNYRQSRQDHQLSQFGMLIPPLAAGDTFHCRFGARFWAINSVPDTSGKWPIQPFLSNGYFTWKEHFYRDLFSRCYFSVPIRPTSSVKLNTPAELVLAGNLPGNPDKCLAGTSRSITSPRGCLRARFLFVEIFLCIIQKPRNPRRWPRMWYGGATAGRRYAGNYGSILDEGAGDAFLRPSYCWHE